MREVKGFFSLYLSLSLSLLSTCKKGVHSLLSFCLLSMPPLPSLPSDSPHSEKRITQSTERENSNPGSLLLSLRCREVEHLCVLLFVPSPCFLASEILLSLSSL